MKRYILLAVLLASPAFAQTPVPTGLLPELAVADPKINSVPFHGYSGIAARGDRFTIVTTNDQVSYTQHGLMEVDAEGKPLLPVTQIVGFCGTAPGIAAGGTTELIAWGCLGSTTALLRKADGTSQEIGVHAPTRTPLFRRDVSGVRSVGWDGEQFVVLSTLETIRQWDPSVDYRAIATRISSFGEILQNDIDLGAGYGYAMASRNGLSVMVIENQGLFIRTMNAAGVVSAPQLLVSGSHGMPAIAAGADGFLVAWNDAGGMHAQRLDADGNPSGPRLLLTSDQIQSPAVAAEGNGYRVAWSIGTTEIRAVRVVSGSVAGAPEVVASGSIPSLGSDGQRMMLVWNTLEGVRAKPIGAGGEGVLVHSLASRQSLQSVAMTASGISIAWQEWPWAGSVRSHLLDPRLRASIDEGTITHLPGLDRALIIEGSQPPFVVRYADAAESAFQVPSRRLFWTGDGFLAVWSDPISESEPFRAGPLFAQRFSASGIPLDAAPRTIGWTLPLDAAYTGPAAAYNGVSVGASHDEILVTFVDPWATVQGVIIRGNETIAIGTVATPYALANPIQIASDGRDFLVTWISNRETVHSYIGSRRVLAGGAMPEEMRVQTGAGTRKERMGTFWTGEHYLVVWSAVDDFGLPRTISGIRIARDGGLMDYPERVIGTIEGLHPQFAYRNELLAIAYERDSRVWWRYAGSPRRRSVAR